MSTHPWMLTGPWYRWAAPGVPAAGRKTKPEIQKYAGFEFARELLAEPQRSLVWKDDDFLARTVTPAWLRERTEIRKLYRPTQGRNYLVVVELHGDAPGLPSVDRREVVEAGFVVRRLRARVEPAHEAETLAALTKLARAKRRRQRLAAWTEGKLGLHELAAAGAFGLDVEAWIPDPIDPLRGGWQPLRDPTPHEQLAGESVIPLYPLNPDPRDHQHSAAGRTLYFGVIPLGGSEADASGAPRFDDQHLFEIRCFVRQPEQGGVAKLVWSEPTIGYRIAADLDPARQPGFESGFARIGSMIAWVLVVLFQLLRLQSRGSSSSSLELDLAAELKLARDLEFEIAGSIDAGITSLAELERWADEALTTQLPRAAPLTTKLQLGSPLPPVPPNGGPLEYYPIVDSPWVS